MYAQFPTKSKSPHSQQGTFQFDIFPRPASLHMFAFGSIEMQQLKQRGK